MITPHGEVSNAERTFQERRWLLVPTAPEAWSVVGGKLYLNYNTTVRSKWEQDVPGYTKAADANWPKLIRQ